MSHVLFFGNGLNLLTDGNPSWDDLLKDISDVEYDKVIPNTFKYEVIIANKPYMKRGALLATNDGHVIKTSDGKHIRFKDEILEENLKYEIAKRVKEFKTNKVYEAIADIKFSHFLTTNYDNVLFKVMGKYSEDSNFKREQIYNIRRRFTLSWQNHNIWYWPIHGTSIRPISIMLGLDQYCGSIAKMKQYIEGGYSVHEYEQLLPIEERLKKGISIDKVISWIDLFFIADVHILGYGLRYEETDIWWLLNTRMRMQKKFEKEMLVKNRIYYYADEPVPYDKFQLFQGFGVEVVQSKMLNDYESRYMQLVDIMKEKVGTYTD